MSHIHSLFILSFINISILCLFEAERVRQCFYKLIESPNQNKLRYSRYHNTFIFIMGKIAINISRHGFNVSPSQVKLNFLLTYLPLLQAFLITTLKDSNTTHIHLHSYSAGYVNLMLGPFQWAKLLPIKSSNLLERLFWDFISSSANRKHHYFFYIFFIDIPF